MARFFGYSKNVFILSVVSFLNDLGGETIKRTLSLFLVNVLGVKITFVGLVEGFTDSSATLIQLFSGGLSDKWGKRKPFIFVGYTLRVVKIFLIFAASWPQVLGIRFLDQTGKGISKAPRDALIAESSDLDKRGRSFGFNRALDSAGAVVGLVAAAAIVWFVAQGTQFLTREIFTWIVILSVIPIALASFLIYKFISDPKNTVARTGPALKFKNLGRPFNLFLFVTFIFTLGNPSEAFLVLRAQGLGLDLTSLFILLATFSLVTALTSTSFGKISDKVGRKRVILAGWLVFSILFFGFSLATRVSHVWLLFLFFGLYLGLTEGVGKALVADLVPADSRGSAFGLYNTVLGLTFLPASLIAGFLWENISPSAPFVFGGVMALFASVVLIGFRRRIVGFNAIDKRGQ